MNNVEATVLRPVGVRICWAPKPDAPVCGCTLPPGHYGDHHHEYSGTSWPRKVSEKH